MTSHARRDLQLVEQDLQRPNVCGAQQTINGKTWVCVRDVHDDGHHTDQWYRGYPPRSQRHYYRRRYPGTNH